MQNLFSFAESTNVFSFSNADFLINRLDDESSTKLGQDEGQLLVLVFNYENFRTEIREVAGVVAGGNNDRTLIFDKYDKYLYKKAEWTCLSYGDYQIVCVQIRKMFLMKPLIELQFYYCPLIRTLHRKGVKSKINYLHEWALQIV